MDTPCVRDRKLQIGAIVVALASPLVAGADEISNRFELVPFGGFRTGGEFETENGDVDIDDAVAFGLAFNARADYHTQWHIYYSHQSTELLAEGVLEGHNRVDLDVDYVQAGGTYYFEGNAVTPYMAATVGAARFDPDPAGFESDTFFAFTVAGGLRVALGERVGLNLEARWLGTLVDSDSEIFCRSGPTVSGCAVRVDGNLVSQFDTTLGIVIPF
jgi:opacity protein-like surface antigen